MPFTLESKVLSNFTSGEPKVLEHTISNGEVSFCALNWGCTITSIMAPDNEGKSEEITLCYREYEDLIKEENFGPYYGAIIGRVANRINQGKFLLNNKQYELEINGNNCHLHGGNIGFDRKLFTSKTFKNENEAGVEFKNLSHSGEEGYPGTLEITIIYKLTAFNTIEIIEKAIMIQDKHADDDEDEDDDDGLSTPVNLTNHTYFNLSGNLKENIYLHKLQLNASNYTPYNKDCIPLGSIESVQNTLYDFTMNGGVELKQRIYKIGMNNEGEGKPGLDHNWCIDGGADPPIDLENMNLSSSLSSTVLEEPLLFLRHAATLIEPKSGRKLTVHTSKPGIQVYTYNWAEPVSDDETSPHFHSPHFQHNGIALETQYYPDTINQDLFPKHGGYIVSKNSSYHHKTIFSFGLSK